MVQPERRNQQIERVPPLTLLHRALGQMLEQIRSYFTGHTRQCSAYTGSLNIYWNA